MGPYCLITGLYISEVIMGRDQYVDAVHVESAPQLFHLKLIAVIAKELLSETYLNSSVVWNKMKSSYASKRSAKTMSLVHSQQLQLWHHHRFSVWQDPDQDLGWVASPADLDGLDPEGICLAYEV